MRIRDFKRTGESAKATDRQVKSLVAIEVAEHPVANVSEMSAYACINTDAIDYQGEAILASGVRLGNYANNPVVLYEHGKGPIQIPIATSESPYGDLMIERSEFDMHGTSYFSQSNPVASQIFGLIDEGIIRATSIQVMPISKSVYVGANERKYPVTEESDLLEWSWCMLGVNPEAVKKSLGFVTDSFVRAWNLQTDRAIAVLEKGSLGGDRLLEPIRKSLLSVIPSPSASSPGADFVKGSKMATELKHMTKLELKKLGKDKLADVVIKGESVYDARTIAQAKSLYEEVTKSPMEKAKDEAELPVDGELPVDDAEAKGMGYDKEEKSLDEMEGDDDDASEVDNDLPLGAAVTSEVYTAMKFLIDHATKVMSPVENEVVKAGLTAAIDEATALMDTIAGIYASAYPDLPALGAVEAEAETVAVEEQMKSMLASHKTAGFRTLGLAGAIERIAVDPSIGEAQRKSLRSLSDRLGQLVEGAKSYKPAPPADMVPVAKYRELEGKVEQLCAKVAQLVVPAS
jgi:hypothetical protein